MKYYTLGTIFLFITLMTILMLFYYSKLTLKIEKNITNIELRIESLSDKIKVNELEYAAHLNSDYLKSLEKIYFFNKYNNDTELRIVGIHEFNFEDLGPVIKISSN